MNDREYEFYLIDNIKAYADKIRLTKDNFMCLNLYDELLNALVKYRTLNFDVDLLPELDVELLEKKNEEM